MDNNYELRNENKSCDDLQLDVGFSAVVQKKKKRRDTTFKKQANVSRSSNDWTDRLFFLSA